MQTHGLALEMDSIVKAVVVYGVATVSFLMFI